MPTFAYKAFDKRNNKEVSDTVEAANQADAITAIKKNGLLPIEIRESKGAAKSTKAKAATATTAKKGASGFGGVKPAQITLFTRQLSTLQDAGLPVVQSLQILTDMQRPGRFKKVLASVTDEVQSGTMLSEAMARYPKIFDRMYTNLVKAGETAGALETILRRLSEFREKAAKLKKKVIGAMVYPAAVMTIAGGILTFIMIVIVPKFEQIFKELNIKLPDLTQLLIDISRLMSSMEGLMTLGGIVGGFMLAIFLRNNTVWGANLFDRVILWVPVIGNIVKKSSVARFTRTLGTLVTSGVGFLDALEIVRNATPNVVVRNAIASVRDSVKEGETINEPLKRSGIFDDIVVNMIKVGEETGELDKMLIKIADTYDEEVDSAVAAMMAMMEPALIIFMGGAVGFIVIALFMPLIQIMQSLGGG